MTKRDLIVKLLPEPLYRNLRSALGEVSSVRLN